MEYQEKNNNNTLMMSFKTKNPEYHDGDGNTTLLNSYFCLYFLSIHFEYFSNL